MEQRPIPRRRAALTLTGANFFIYGMTSAYSAFMPVYLSAHHSSIVKGYLLSIGCVVSLFAPVAVGKLTDRARSKNLVLAVIAALAAVLFSASYLSSGAVYLAVVLAALTFCNSPLGGLLDTVTLEGTAAGGVAYGPVRMMGTVGFGVVAVVMGILATRSLGAAFAVYPAVAALGIVCLLRAPQTPGHADPREKLPVLPILRDRNIRLLFLLNAVGYFCFFYCQHFYNEYVLDLLGLPAWVWGLHSFMNILLEIPFFFLFDKIMRRVSLRAMLSVCMAVSVVRYLLLPVVSTAAGILLTAALTGGWVTFITYCVTLYIKRHMPPALIASSIGLQYALPLGAGTLLADLAGGYLTSFLGIRGGLFLCAGICALAFPCALLLRVPKEA
ncbi:MAG: MFS transporter [Oscillospiraceae bacterium]|nr:MFS transporter [Oscillospiraceae bacterium]